MSTVAAGSGSTLNSAVKFLLKILKKLITMATGFSLDDTDFGDEEESNAGYQDWSSLVFLIDASKRMQESEHFLQSLETYKNIVRQKCASNKKDKVGLFLFGLEDSNCDVSNVYALQEFKTVDVDSLKTIKRTIKNDLEKYKKLASDSKYPLHEVLAHSTQILHSAQKNPQSRNIVVLCTNNDSPCSDNPSERQRIVNLVATFKDINVELRVVGLSDSWKDDYYKDLQIASGTFRADNYKRISFKDFEHSIVSPARAVCRLPWKISQDLTVEVALINIVSVPTYPTKVKLEKEGNQILQSNFVLQKQGAAESQQSQVEEKKVITSDKLLYYREFGGECAYFDRAEQAVFKNMGFKPSIEILAFKPVVCNPLHYLDSAYLVINTASNNYDSKLFFTSFIKKCAERRVMPICKVITKANVYLSMMIPSEEDHGFYMMHIPFSDSVRDLDLKLEDYIFNAERKCSVSEKAVERMKELMDATSMDLDIKQFKNPKLEKFIAHIEALALDEKLEDLPPDSTLPPPPKGDVENLVAEIKNLLNLDNLMIPVGVKRTQTQKSYDSEKRIKYDIKMLAENGQLSKLTQADMQQFLRGVNLPYSGTKAKLIERINKYYEL